MNQPRYYPAKARLYMVESHGKFLFYQHILSDMLINQKHILLNIKDIIEMSIHNVSVLIQFEAQRFSVPGCTTHRIHLVWFTPEQISSVKLKALRF